MADVDFVLEETLGIGAFGKVYLVTSSEDSKQYAMKVIDFTNIKQSDKDLAHQEAKLLERIRHEYVLNYTDAFESGGSFCIVTEYCANGDLSQYLERQHGRKLDEDLLKKWFKQMTLALQYLHSKLVIHRDVKTPNIFLTQSLDTKLGDMGLAKVLERPSAKAITFCGSPYYMSPEIFSAKPYGLKTDIWALGVIVYEMAILERPFDAKLMNQLVSKIVHGELPRMPEGYGQGLNDLLTKMMQKDEELRPSADMILKHSYFEGGSKAKAVPQHPVPLGTSADFARSARWGDLITKPTAKSGKRSVDDDAGAFKVNGLLGVLSEIRREKDKKKMTLIETISEESLKGIPMILANSTIHEVKKNKYKDKKKKYLPEEWSRRMEASASNIDLVLEDMDEEDLTSTLVDTQNKTATDAFDLMCTMISMVTGHLPDDDADMEKTLTEPEGHMSKIIIQINHLKRYCKNVIQNDKKFSQVQDLLKKTKDDDELEQAMLKLLGQDKYDRCCVQLIFWKNFQYNLDKQKGNQAK